jgi:NodT family efflux transporter outer membrane factor (OMF) lipoprotein
VKPVHSPIVSILAALLIFSGCTVGPDYRRPDLDTGTGWTLEATDTAQPGLAEWWVHFDDPTLNRLVARAVSQNLTVRQAVARVREARALYGAATGRRQPAVDLSGSVTRRRLSENGALPVGRIPGLERDQTIYQTGFDAVWELDLFGGIGRGVEAAQARLDETTAVASSTKLHVLAEVVRLYIVLRQSQQELDLQRDIVETGRQTHELVLRQLAAGAVTGAEVSQSESRLTTEQARLPAIEAEIRASALALSLLAGDLPEEELPLTRQSPKALKLTAVPVGTRAGLLRRRPDVQAAELRLAAATAEIGQTIAELFPRLTIGAGGGFESLDGADLLQATSQTWRIAPLISWRVFEGGRIRARIEAGEAATERLALAYEHAVLQALNEAEQALTRYHFGLESIKRQHEAVRTARQYYDYAALRYRAGDVALFELLDARQKMFGSQNTLNRLQRTTAIDLVALYKALGGGWQPGEETISP